MEQDIYSSALGTASFKVTYRTVALQTAPAFTATSLGTLKRGAVVTVLEDVSRYFLKVRLDNGLEGYVYKPGGEVSNSLPPTPLPPVPTQPTANGTLPATDIDGAVVRGRLNGVEPPLHNAQVRTTPNGNGRETASTTYSNINPRRSSNGSRKVVVTSGEIAALDKPGIVGKQIGKLRRNDILDVVGEDSFFYQVALPNGATGFIPRYAADYYN